MKLPEVTVVDFETEAIVRRPVYPPKPVGVSIQRPGERKPTYWAWDHPEKNNCDRSKGYEIIKDVWKWARRQGHALLFHSAKFDTDVAETHVGVEQLSWEHIHDTEFLIFLQDPYSKRLSLKPTAERLLGMPPEERDAVKDWLVDHGIVNKNQKDWGAHISKAPGDLVGKYANGDDIRTKRLFEHLYPEICQRDMQAAYQRELRLLPILLRTEREGIRVNLGHAPSHRQVMALFDWPTFLHKGVKPTGEMEHDYVMYQCALWHADQWLRKKLHAPNLNLDADKDVGDVLDREGIITQWRWTPGGRGRAPQRSVSKKNMPLTIFENKQVAAVFGYRQRLKTCLSMFMLTWLEQARETGGTIHTQWNQVRQNHGEDQTGTRSGRLSSTPNFQNISKNFEAKTDGYFHPKFLDMLPPLPLMRSYLIPDEGCVWGRRDINQQELRLLAHFEDGKLMQAYLDNPRLDVHGIVQNGIKEILGLEFERTRVKTFVFQNVYGGGAPAATAALGCDGPTARKVINVLMQVLPGYEALLNRCKTRGDKPIRTWGGREYYCEPPAFIKKFKRWMTFEYKRLNYLIQPSAADVTKEIMIRYDALPKQSRFLLSVHDEFDFSIPKKVVKQEMKLLRDCIQSIETDVPMLSDGEIGKNWGTLTKFKEN